VLWVPRSPNHPHPGEHKHGERNDSRDRSGLDRLSNQGTDHDLAEAETKVNRRGEVDHQPEHPPLAPTRRVGTHDRAGLTSDGWRLVGWPVVGSLDTACSTTPRGIRRDTAKGFNRRVRNSTRQDRIVGVAQSSAGRGRTTSCTTCNESTCSPVAGQCASSVPPQVLYGSAVTRRRSAAETLPEPPEPAGVHDTLSFAGRPRGDPEQLGLKVVVVRVQVIVGLDFDAHGPVGETNADRTSSPGLRWWQGPDSPGDLRAMSPARYLTSPPR
jgi:hypothetical protein